MNMSSLHDCPLAFARSFLFVPGNRPQRFEKAVRSGADAVVLDLEDAVPLADKSLARHAIGDSLPRLRELGVPLLVRINAASLALGEEDLRWLAHLPGVAGVMLPKAESDGDVLQVRAAAHGVPVLPIIESAAGHAALQSIAAAPGVLRLVVGHIDFMADTGLQCGEEQAELAPLRFAVAMATRLNGLAPAIDGVTVEVGDEARLHADALRAVRFGFGGKLCIHPGQVAALHRSLTPTEGELAWARRVIEADRCSGGAALQLDGRMVDAPVVLQARRALARAGAA